MSDYGRISKAIVKAIADALRYCNGNEAQYTPVQMPNAVRLLKKRLTQKTITRNGVYIPTSGYDGFDRVTVNVEGGDTVLVEKSITANGTYDPADDLAGGYSGVTVNVPPPVLVSKNITANGNYSPVDDNADGYSSVSVAVPGPNLQSKTATQNGTVTPDTGYDGLSAVDVAVPNTYSAADNGKVVSGGQLVAQSSMSIASNGNYDTTLYNEVNINVSGGGGGDGIWPKIVDKTITEISDSAGSIQNIGIAAFCYCNELSSVSFPAAESLGAGAFSRCSALAEVSFPEVINIDEYCFEKCNALATASFPKAKIIGTGAFRSCAALSTVSFPAAQSIGTSAFQSCTALTDANFPEATFVAARAFASCTSLATAVFPKLQSVVTQTFQGCTALSLASFPEATEIGSVAFVNCFNLVSLYLLGSSFCSLTSKTAFNSTPIGGYSASAGQFGSIYVPASLYSLYTATGQNWYSFSSRFVSVGAQ